MNAYTDTIESENTSGSMSAFMAGAAIGAAVGAAAALIFAPANGRDTRAYLKRRGNELGQDALERGREVMRTQSERVKSAVADGWDRASDAIGHVRERGQTAYREAKDSLQSGEPDVIQTGYESRGQR
jgi:gas vesicle protein